MIPALDENKLWIDCMEELVKQQAVISTGNRLGLAV